MICINNIILSVHHTEEDLINKAAHMLRIQRKDVKGMQILHRSLDARKKNDITFVYTICIHVDSEKRILSHIKDARVTKYVPKEFCISETEKKRIKNREILSGPHLRYKTLKSRPVIAGFGPAGIFAALTLARLGYNPVVLERGENASDRVKTVKQFWEKGILDPQSNVSFGEGGAGTFSDGKLTTQIKDRDGIIEYILKNLVEFGANPEIIYLNKPHIGTDALTKIVTNMRNEIIRLGGEVRFCTQADDIEITEKKITAVKTNDGSVIKTDILILATGHSARDTYKMLKSRGIKLSRKNFAVGVRIIHPQKMIDIAQFGNKDADFLSPAAYKLTSKSNSGRGVYTFCMCPGGYVIDASSEKNALAVNGMSYNRRDSGSANSAVVVTVGPNDFIGDDVLSGIELQKELEEKAYKSQNGRIPVQLYGDFKNKIISDSFGDVKPCFMGKTEFDDLNRILPDYLCNCLIEAIEIYDGKLHGFARKDAILAGVESRTSAPVRIERGNDFEADIEGLYPCGEGAGYAGGITSAAADGIRVAKAVAQRYAPSKD